MCVFEAIKICSKVTTHAYNVVWSWFKKKFPNYNKVPEFNDDLKIAVTPEGYIEETTAA